jgi:hypothetical protein
MGCIAIAAGALLVAAGPRASGVYLICVGAAVVLGTAFERWRYRNTPPAGAHWERTGERFEDPPTGATLEVQYDRASGERRYVSTAGSSAGK